MKFVRISSFSKKSSLLGSTEPLAAVFTTVFWLIEPFGSFQWIGTTCILIMILLLALNKEPFFKNDF
ncbi:hypothetical protein BTR23_21605 [Alkalihalophilus pseudofirmus]|nr:hypothetical protein BTR23_21605 [Alkalihalophilus pseudofirmus]